MKWRILKAVAVKECIHVVRDWRSLGISLAIPVLLLLLFGYALNMDLTDVPTIVWDQSGTPLSRDFQSLLEGSPYFRIVKRVDNYREIENGIGSGKALIAIVIPANFSSQIKSGRQVKLQAIIDGSEANTARFVQNYALVVSTIFNSNISLRINSARTHKTPTRIELQPRAWYNQDLRSRHVIVPGVIAIVMIIISAMLTSVTIAREWETGTMEQLISTPVAGVELILGKVFPYFLIGFLDLLISVVLGRFLFGVPLRGSIGLLFIVSSFFLSGSLFLGLLISIRLKKQVIANQTALIISYLPTLFLSGFVFSIDNMPRFLQNLSHIVPARYYISILKSIFLKGVGLEIIIGNALIMVFYAFLMFMLAHKSLRLKME